MNIEPFGYSLSLGPGPTKDWGRPHCNTVWNNEPSGWQGLLVFFEGCSNEHFNNKEEAELISPHKFANDYRSKTNAIHSSWLFLDMDKDADVVRDCAKLDVLGIEAFVYSSPSHHWKIGHRFRIIVPVTEPFSSEFYWAAANGLNYAMGSLADTTKLGCDSWCFIPGQYKTAEQTIDGKLIQYVPDYFSPIHIKGAILPVVDWIACCPQDVLEYGNSTVKAVFVDWKDFQLKTDIYQKKGNVNLELFVQNEKMRSYNGVGGGTGKTNAMFGLMLSITHSAIRAGIFPTAEDIAITARNIDRRSGGYLTAKYPQDMNNYARKSGDAILAAAQQNIMEAEGRKNEKNRTTKS